MSRCCPLLLLALAAAPACAQTPVGQLFASDASVKGSVVMAAGGAQVMPGSSVTAGAGTASLRLGRGGEMRICPRAALSVNTAQNGRDLLLGMSTGQLEFHYTLARSADTLMTPDFRLELVGPGEFHVAIGADTRGNTCVRTLPGNTASVIVTELMGHDVYQVPRDGQVLFHSGSMLNPDTLAPDCGCPAPPPVERAASPLPPSPLPPPGTPHLGKPAPADPAIADSSLTAPPPPMAPGATHVQIDAPFVFNAAVEPPVEVPPPPTVSRLHPKHLPPALVSLPATARPPELAAAPPERKPPLTKPAQKKGVFGHLRSFFAAIFREILR